MFDRGKFCRYIVLNACLSVWAIAVAATTREELFGQLDAPIGETMEIFESGNSMIDRLIYGQYYPFALRLPLGEGRMFSGLVALRPTAESPLFIARSTSGKRSMPLRAEILGLMMGLKKYSDVIDLVTPGFNDRPPALRVYRNEALVKVGTGPYIHGGFIISHFAVVYNPFISSWGFDDEISGQIIKAHFLREYHGPPEREFASTSVGNPTVTDHLARLFPIKYHEQVIRALNKATGRPIRLELVMDIERSEYRGHINVAADLQILAPFMALFEQQLRPIVKEINAPFYNSEARAKIIDPPTRPRTDLMSLFEPPGHNDTE